MGCSNNKFFIIFKLPVSQYIMYKLKPGLFDAMKAERNLPSQVGAVNTMERKVQSQVMFEFPLDSSS